MPSRRWLIASPMKATSPPLNPPPSNSTSPPPQIPPVPRPPPRPTAPPPKPPTSSPPPPSTPARPSSPPPSIPATPSSPPPSIPVTPTLPPPPLPAPPYSPPPSAPPTPSVPPPIMPSPPGTPEGLPPSVPIVPFPPPPPATPPTVIPSPPASDHYKIIISKRAVVGISIGAVAVFVLLCLFFYYMMKKRKKTHYYQDDSYDIKPQQFQHNVAPLAEVQPRPPAPPPYASPQLPYLPPPPPPPLVQFSSASGGNNSGSEPLTPLAPNFTPAYASCSFTYEELSMATNGFSDFNLLGQGGFGYVHKGLLPNGQEVAVKQLKAGSGQGEREFQAEVEIISRVHHKHLVSLVGYCISGDHRLLVYEYVPNKTLEFHLHGKNVSPMDWPTRLKIALGSAKGLAYLHEDCRPKIIHRDIKAANILLEINFDAKVADFGLAKLTSETNTHVSTRVMGTFGYLAPEYASSGKLTEKSDVFSFGVMLLELITGKRPVDSTHFYAYDSLVDWARPMLSKAMKDDNYVDLIDPRLGDNYNKDEIARMVACAASCVRHSAQRRPIMSKIVRALEGHVSLDNLNEGIRPGLSSIYDSSYGSTDYDNMKYKEDLRKFRNIALSSTDGASSEYSAPSSEVQQQSVETKVAKVKKHTHSLSG